MSLLNNRSAFEAIQGKDALFEYQSKPYPPKTYVERNGLIFKSLTATSATFISSQWEIIDDLREVRVPNIASRNALTGSTPTSGTTGIRIPILDNTNVLVLNAIADPQVAVNNFARYNYNQTNASWLLLQIGTGATNSNVNDYQLLINKPSVISGVTVSAGNGLSGGGTILGTNSAPYAAGGTITIAHADTSSQASLNNSGYTYVQNLKFDTYGHTTGSTSSTWVHPDTSTQASINNTGTTYIQSVSLDGDGHVTTLSSSIWVHPDTSTQASSNNNNNIFIQSVFLDGAGHVIGINAAVVPTGGTGYNFKINGNSGGVLTVLSGATLNISGGTNILTTRTGNGTNPGIKISVNPAGLNNQIQLNNSGVLGSSANLTFTGGTTLVTNKLSLTGVPSTGTVNDDVLVRDSTTNNIKKVTQSSLVPSYTLVAYVSTNGNDGTGQVSVTNRPFLTVQAAINAIAALTPTITTRGLVMMMHGFFNEIVSLANFIDINMNNCELITLKDNSVAVDSRIFGFGKLKNVLITAASTISIECDEISNAGNTAISINAPSQLPEIKISTKKIIGNVQANNGKIIINTKILYNGSITPFSSGGTLNLIMNVDYGEILNGDSNSLINFSSISFNANAKCYIHFKKAILSNPTSLNSLFFIDTVFRGELTLICDEAISINALPVINSLQTNPTSKITIGGRFVNTNAGNISSARISSLLGSICKILSGTQFVPSGTGFSITNNTNPTTIVALGQIYGKNANDVGVTIQLGTFTANSTFIN